MAKTETKSVSVLPRDEQKAIKFHEKFGWSVQSSQEIFNRDTKQEVKDNIYGDSELWNVTTTTNYVKIIFQRDKEMKNYAEIVDFEKKYEANTYLIERAPGLFPGKILSILIILLLIGTFGSFAGGAIGSGILSLLIAGGIFAARFFLIYKPKDEKASKAYAENKKIDEALEKL